MSFFSPDCAKTVHWIDFKLGRCIADDPRLCFLWEARCSSFMKILPILCWMSLLLPLPPLLSHNTDSTTLRVQPTLWSMMGLHLLELTNAAQVFLLWSLMWRKKDQRHQKHRRTSLGAAQSMKIISSAKRGGYVFTCVYIFICFWAGYLKKFLMHLDDIFRRGRKWHKEQSVTSSSGSRNFWKDFFRIGNYFVFYGTLQSGIKCQGNWSQTIPLKFMSRQVLYW